MAQKQPSKRPRARRPGRAAGLAFRRPYSDAEPNPSLLAKYQALVCRYAALMTRNQDRVLRQSASTVFALAALKSSVTGIAFVRAGIISRSNKRFRDFAKRAAQWRLCEGSGPPSKLEDAVLSAAVALGRAGTQAVLQRYERVGSDQVIDVRLERLGQGSVDSCLVLATLVDVSDIVRATRELEEARRVAFEQERFRTMGELTSGFAHDFNNTLHAMNLWMARLGQSQRMGPEERRALGALLRIVSDAAVRVGQLQDFSRNRSDVPDEWLDLSEAIQAASELFLADVDGGVSGPNGSFHIKRRIQRDLPAARGSGPELRHVFLNLLLNARDAMPRGGGIAIAARRQGDRIVVTVEDEGSGIPEEHLRHVFDPFFTTKGSRGTGLGLSIAYRVMQRLGGSITATNGAHGGAVFRLVFPVALVPETARESAPPVAPSAPAPKRVLIVDDDEDNLEVLRTVLEGLGQAVTAASSGASAIERASEAQFDLVLCDLGMPEMNGWKVAESLRELASGTPVYLLTGWANEIPPDDPRRELVSAVLPKPLGLDKLAHLLGAEASRIPP